MIKPEIDFEEFMELLEKWSEKIRNYIPERLKHLFEISEEGRKDAKYYFNLAKHSNGVLIIFKKEYTKLRDSAGLFWRNFGTEENN